jgi:CARDB
VHVEDPVRPGHDFDDADRILALFEQPRRQTGGVGSRPSGNAVLDPHVVAVHHHLDCRRTGDGKPGSWRSGYRDGMVVGRVIGVLIVALLASAAASAGGRADLVETTVSVSQDGVSLRVRDSIRNAGTAVAPRSRASFYLGTRRIGGRTIPSLPPGAISRRSTSLPIPASIPAGTYRLRACVDPLARIPESNERNNCRAAVQRVRVDRAPPSFAGLDQVTTCIPGPIGHDRSSHYFLKWSAARDDVTPAAGIVYDVYESTTAGGEDFARPTYTTKAGATSFTTPLLPADTAHYFVVRARDRAGNRSATTIERMGVSICV